MNLEQAKLTFVDEARELLQSMEDLLLAAEAGEADAEAINALFRCAHTIKGSAGLFGLDPIVAFTHTVESVLDRVRNAQLNFDGTLAAVLLECRDHIGVLMREVAHEGREVAPETAAAGATLVERLRAYLAQGVVTPAPAPSKPVANEPAADIEFVGGGRVGADTWHISLRFGRDVFRNGMDPLPFLSYLGEIGTITHVETLIDAIPAAAEMDPESCYLGFEIDLRCDRDKAAIEAVFDFVRDDCSIRILPPREKLAEYIRLIEDLPENVMRLGDILVKGGALTPHELEQALAQQAAQRETGGKMLGEIVVEDKLVSQQVVAAALDKQKQVDEKRAIETKMLKVPAEKLDTLIDLVGELVISGASVNALAQKTRNAAMVEAVSAFSRLVEDIRDASLRLRMVQIGDTFSRFPRVVRDLSRELGKDIRLVITGGETELDKSMIERIGDPLMHLVRNAIDHGIETATRRMARGKPEKGTLRLHAHHDSGSVVIEVSDDGGGLDAHRIRAKALEKGLVAPDQPLNESEIYKLILEPGFSTAEKVTSLSGRGVGMDVVKKNIEALRGSIEIESASAIGTTIKLRLPLTLAIIDGFLVEVDGAYYVIPLEMVVECVELSAADQEAAHGRHYIGLRGEVLPFLRMREVFEVAGPPPARENVVVVAYAGGRAGLVVDKLLGEFQTVIKPLSKLFQRLHGIGGSTILGTGEVALIIDVPSLVQSATDRESQRDAGAVPSQSPQTNH